MFVEIGDRLINTDFIVWIDKDGDGDYLADINGMNTTLDESEYKKICSALRAGGQLPPNERTVKLNIEAIKCGLPGNQ